MIPNLARLAAALGLGSLTAGVVALALLAGAPAAAAGEADCNGAAATNARGCAGSTDTSGAPSAPMLNTPTPTPTSTATPTPAPTPTPLLTPVSPYPAGWPVGIMCIPDEPVNLNTTYILICGPGSGDIVGLNDDGLVQNGLPDPFASFVTRLFIRIGIHGINERITIRSAITDWFSTYSDEYAMYVYALGDTPRAVYVYLSEGATPANTDDWQCSDDCYEKVSPVFDFSDVRPVMFEVFPKDAGLPLNRLRTSMSGASAIGKEYFTHEAPVLDGTYERNEANTLVTLTWTAVTGGSHYVMLLNGNALTEYADPPTNEHLLQRSFRIVIPNDGATRTFHVAAVLRVGSFNQTVNIADGTTFTAPANTTWRSRASAPYEITPYIAAPSVETLLPDPEPDDDFAAATSLLGKLVGSESTASTTVVWAILTVGVSVLVASPFLREGIRAAPVALGVGVGSLMWGIGGPTTAGVPWPLALTPPFVVLAGLASFVAYSKLRA